MRDLIHWAKPELWGNEKQYVTDALESLWISGGDYIDRLEQEFRSLLGRKFALAVCNGTAALHLPYLALRLKPGHEVIVPGFAFMAAANMAVQLGLKPVFAEVDPATWCLTAAGIAPLITAKTKAVVPVNTYGNLCNVQEIVSLTAGTGIAIIEDCAESLFSKYDGRQCGTSAEISSFSFQATKTITTGEGGLVVTDEEELATVMQLYRSHGLRERGTYFHEVPGHNFRITNIQAAFGCAQLEKKETIIGKRKNVHAGYRRLLTGKDGLQLQSFAGPVDPVLWAFAVRLEQKAFPQGRDVVISQLREKGIETRPGFTSSSLLKIYEPHKLPICEELSAGVISLPTYATLEDDEIDYICRCLLELKR